MSAPVLPSQRIQAELRQPSSLPWESVDGVLLPDDEGRSRSFVRPVKSIGWQIAQTVGPDGPDHAAFIVTACNSHARLSAEIEGLKDLLSRWLNIAENGKYGHRTNTPLAIHPIVEETYAALQQPKPADSGEAS